MKKYLMLLFMPIILLVLVILGGLIYINLLGNNITIYNDSSDTITNLTIISSNRDNIIIGDIGPSNKVKIKIPESFNEGDVTIKYFDNKGVVHNGIIIGYLILAENNNYSYHIK